jgi:thiosulfate dehydrogenase [quinone] large subunit
MSSLAGTTQSSSTALNSSQSTLAAARIWALLRISLGLVFLWAFLDKLLALGFATGRSDNGSVDFFGPDAWINGGSPTSGFLLHGTDGPMASLFRDIAGTPIVDWLFMLGMLGVGMALLLGIGMRVAAVAGAAQMLLIRAASPVPENNPIVDEHIIYALALFALLFAAAGDHWGFGKAWRRTRVVQRFPLAA